MNKPYDIIEEFDKALIAGDSPSIREYVSSAAEDEQLRLLLDLIDMEIRHRIRDKREAVSMLKYRSDYCEVTDDEWSGLILLKQKYERAAFFSAGDTAAHGNPKVPGYNEWTKFAQGAMGVLWVAEKELVPSVQEAFKVPSEKFLDICGRTAVIKEAKAAARVQHKNVCKVLDVDPAGAYIHMEFIKGGTLEKWGNQRSLLEIARMVAQICHGLHAIHEAGILHQDLKPANVVVEGDRTSPKSQTLSASTPPTNSDCPLSGHLPRLDEVVGHTVLSRNEDENSQT